MHINETFVLSVKKSYECGIYIHLSQIAEEMKPSPFVISILTKLISIIPKWKIIPSQDIIEISYKEPEIRKQVCFYITLVIKMISL